MSLVDRFLHGCLPYPRVDGALRVLVLMSVDRCVIVLMHHVFVFVYTTWLCVEYR